jgi:lysozyme
MTTDTIIDISHFQSHIDFAKVAASGITAIIAKATQGSGIKDVTFDDHKNAARGTFLWGSYHFGTGDDVQLQVQNYLKVAKPTASDLICLDFEANRNGPSMSLAQARDFVSLCQASLGRWPVLYAGHVLKEALGSHPDPVLANCPLWLAQYGPTAVLPPGWSTYTLWQFTDGSVGSKPLPGPIDGLGLCDRDRFAGTPDELQQQWPFT